MKTIIFITEASSQIGFGHLVECINLAKGLSKEFNLVFFINENKFSIKLLSNFSYMVYKNHDELIGLIKKYVECNAIIINLQSVSLELINEAANTKTKVVVIDELGNKPIVSDILINGSVIEEWHNYSFPVKKPKLYFGPKYMILNEDFSLLHEEIRSKSDVILISMGGADRTCITAKIMNALKNTGNIKKVVIGPGFRNKKKLELINKQSGQEFEFIYGTTNTCQLILEAGIIFTAGGDTLYEAACLGTPAIVLWEDPHEKKQADWFAHKGAAINLGRGIDAKEKNIKKITHELLSDTAKWIQMSNCGKRIVDGNGIERIVKIIKMVVSS